MSALLVALAYLAIQQLEGNYLTPKIQGDALGVHLLLVFLAVVAGGDLAGLLGVILAVPALAVLQVLFDFFRSRLRTKPRPRRTSRSSVCSFCWPSRAGYEPWK